jgi:EpsI family protein
MSRFQGTALVILLVAVALGAWPLYQELHSTWTDQYGAMSHGYLVLALSLWFGVRAWRSAPALPAPTAVWWMAPILVALVLCSFLAEQLFIGGIRSALLPLQFLAAVATCLGIPAARRLTWPALFLYFGLPVWNPLNGLLQSATVHVAQFLLQIVGVPAFVEGNFVQLPEGTFQIAAGCAGMSFFIVALTMGAYACTLHVHQWTHRWKLMLAAVVAGLVANWLRVSSLIVIGYLTNMQSYLIRVDHLLYGWVLFMVAMVPVFWLTRRFTDSEQEAVAPIVTLGPAGAATGIPATVWLAVAVCCAIVLAPLLWFTSAATVTPAANEPFPSGWLPQFVGASETREIDPQSVEVFRASYSPQSRTARISLPENTLTGHDWRATGSDVISVPTRSGSLDVIEYRGFLRGRERLIWVWYAIAGRTATSKIGYRLAEVHGLLAGRHDASVTAISSDCRGNCENTRPGMRAALDRLLNASPLPSPSQFAKP